MKNTSVLNLNLALRAKLSLDGGCVKSLFTALRVELCFVRHIVFMISRSEIMKNTSVLNLNLARSAKLYFDRHIIFEISRSEISKMMCLSKQYFAAAGGKRLFTQSQSKESCK